MEIRNLLASVGVFGAIIASAATPAFTTDPAAGPVESLKSVAITFTDAETVALGTLSYANAPRVVKDGLDPTTSANCNFSFKPSVEGTTLTCPLSKEITDEGTYNFYLPAGLMIVDGTTLDEQIMVTYNVGTVPVAEEKDYITTPEEGEVAILSEITITFPKAETVTIGGIGYATAPRLVKDGTDASSSANCNFSFKPTAEGNTLKFPLAKTEEKPGAYTFTVYASTVTIDGEQMAENIELKYVIPTAEYKLAANDESVLSEIASLSFSIDLDAEIVLKDADATLELVNTYNNETYEGTVTTENNKLTVTFAPAVTDPAPYSITIPKGFFSVNGVENNREWTFEYRISGTGEYTVSIVPEEGTVEELSSFAITFEGSPLSLGSLDGLYNPKIIDASNSYVGVQIEAQISNQTLNLTLQMGISKKGEYTLLIPRGLIKLNDENPTNDLRFNYTVDPSLAGVSTLTPDAATAEYFNLNGIRIAAPEKGIFVKKCNGKSEKVVIK